MFRRTIILANSASKPGLLFRSLHLTKTLSVDAAIPLTKCTLIPGDGVGPEIIGAVQAVFQAADVPIEFESFFLSEHNAAHSAPLDDVIKSINDNGVCLMSALSSPDFSRTGELATLNMKIRRRLDLYANVVHVKTLPGLNTRYRNIDMAIIREQTEGEYSALEHESVPGVVECLKIITAAKCERIAKFAFDYATRKNRKKITAVHKANIMKLGDGLFLSSCVETSKLYPRIKFEPMIVDNCTMQLVSHPEQFDVMVTPNLYGNILDNIAVGMVGGAGVVSGASYSPECVVFQQGARHAFFGGANKNIANPTAMLLSSVNMLSHINLTHHAAKIRKAVDKVLLDGKIKTKDLGGNSTTHQFTTAVINNLR